MLRSPDYDKLKSAASLKNQITKGLTCSLDECCNPLTMMQGPGDKKLCRDHQIQQREYGGPGRIDRPWTFAREWCCVQCGYNPKEDLWFKEQIWSDEHHLYRAMRSMLIGDHIVRKTDGGTDGPSNIQTLCLMCNGKKTALNKDYQRSKLIA